jgi:hypothetical protein
MTAGGFARSRRRARRAERATSFVHFCETAAWRVGVAGKSSSARPTKEMEPMSDEFHSHPVEPESSGLAGYAAIKYTAIVIVVLAILAFLAWYLIPAFK